VRYALLAMLMIGCYEAPDYSGTRFKCDVDHPCPPGQTCVSGTCNGNGSNGSVDAPTQSAGVLCGATTCDVGEKCCATFINVATCIAVGATCAGIAATCDGIEDCTGGTCCEGGGGQQIACAATCTATTICRENTDCPNSAPMCCPNIGTMEPWGRCFTVCP
jgi:hypothetical protein